MDHELSTSVQPRVMARRLARPLSREELERVAGGDCPPNAWYTTGDFSAPDIDMDA
jgi:hypothetical protein